MSKYPHPTKTTLNDVEHQKLLRMTNHAKSLMLTPSFLFVQGLPRIVGESCIDDGRMMFSIRGSDEAMYHAYFANFVKTWGDYVVFRDSSPIQLKNGEWVIIAWTTRQIWDQWHTKK